MLSHARKCLSFAVFLHCSWVFESQCFGLCTGCNILHLPSMSGCMIPLIRRGTSGAGPQKMNHGRISCVLISAPAAEEARRDREHAPLASGQREDSQVTYGDPVKHSSLISIHCIRPRQKAARKVVRIKMFLDPLLLVFSRPPSSSCPTHRRTRSSKSNLSLRHL